VRPPSSVAGCVWPSGAHGHELPQYVGTSLTQMLSQSVSQQYGSAAHTFVTHALQPSVSALPAVQSECEHEPPPPPLELPLLEPLLPPELLPPPLQVPEPQ